MAALDPYSDTIAAFKATMMAFAANLQNPMVVKTLWIIGMLLVAFAVYLLLVAAMKRQDREQRRSLLRNYLAWFFILPVLLMPLLAGPSPWVWLVLALSLICLREFGLATGLWRDRRFMWVAAACIAGIFYPVLVRWYSLFVVMPIYATLLLLTVPITRDAFEHMIQRTCLSVLAVLYFGWCLAHLAYLIHIENGIGHVFFVLLLVELNDICAFSVGKTLGKHKLSPRLSPNKTIEGSLGALIGTIGFGFVFRYLIPEYSTFHLVLIAGLISMTGTFGDLAISFIKRDLGIKDMGKVLPGHGGVLDRLDSLIFVAPIFFHFTVYFYPWLHNPGWWPQR
jgi:phosphatidate cytidylyltransferase